MAKTPTYEGLNILIRRKGVGLSQKELAAMLGVDQPVISRWEAGGRIPRSYEEMTETFDECEKRLLELVDSLISLAEASDSSEIAYPMYISQADYSDQCVYAQKLPYLGMYQQAVAYASMIVREGGRKSCAELA
jgi:DNA-binding helix-turn-helix protein